MSNKLIIVIIIIASIFAFSGCNRLQNNENTNFKKDVVQKKINDEIADKSQDTLKLNKNNNEGEEINEDKQKVKDLFIEKYFIEDTSNDNTYLALKQDPNRFIFKVTVNEFDYSKNMYVISLHRSTDTAINYFLYDPNKDKFFRDGTELSEIKNQSDVFVWVP